jgi:urease accessory protein
MPVRAISWKPAGSDGLAFDHVVLPHHERRLRRKTLTLTRGEKILVDLKEPVTFSDGDLLVLEDGRLAEVKAAREDLYAVEGRDAQHLAELAWHVGNRHIAAQIDETRLVIERDHVIADMLRGLGARVTEISAPFSPAAGAYHSHPHYHP